MSPGKRRHVPVRTCVSCGLKTAKRELLRVVASPDDGVVVDEGGRRNGRGTYLCGVCRQDPQGLSRGRLEYTLRTRIAEDDWRTLLSAVTAITGDAASPESHSASIASQEVDGEQ